METASDVCLAGFSLVYADVAWLSLSLASSLYMWSHPLLMMSLLRIVCMHVLQPGSAN